MFGYRQLGTLEDVYLSVAAESGDGSIYVGAGGTGYTPLTDTHVSGPSALYTLAGEVFTPVTGFDGEDRWVEALLPDDTGVWAGGGIWNAAYQGPAIWRVASGVLVSEATYAGAWSHAVGYVTSLGLLGDTVYGVHRVLWQRDGTALAAVSGADAGAYDVNGSHCCRTLRTRLYWIRGGDDAVGWTDGEQAATILHDEEVESAWPDVMATFQGRLWGLVIVRDAGTGVPSGQQLAWWDGGGWRSQYSWEIASGYYMGMAEMGGRLFLYGNLNGWVLDSVWPCVGEWDGVRLRLGIPMREWWIERMVTRVRRGMAVVRRPDPARADVGGFEEWPSTVLGLDMDLRVEAVIQEFGDGTGETPVVSAVSQEFGDGSGETPVVTEIVQEFGDGASGPAAGESILWVTNDDTDPCVALRVTTGAGADIDVQCRGLVRCDAETADVDDWESYQEFALNEQVIVEAPGSEVRVGIIKPDAVDEELSVSVQLRREAE